MKKKQKKVKIGMTKIAIGLWVMTALFILLTAIPASAELSLWDRIANIAGKILGENLSNKIEGIDMLGATSEHYMEEYWHDSLYAPDVAMGFRRLEMGSATDTAYWLNNTGATTTIEFAEMGFVNQTASNSSFCLNAFATSSKDVWEGYHFADYTPLGSEEENIILLDFHIASSSTGTTTDTNTTTMPNGTVDVANGDYVVLFMSHSNCSWFDNTCAGADCEEATSTNRGFDPYLIFRYHLTDTSNW